MTYADSLAALADPTRRLVFETVSRSPNSVGAVARSLPVSRPAVSQHLKVLSDAGLVNVEAMGTRRIYSVRQAGLADLRAYLDQFWDRALTAYATEIQTMKGIQNDRSDHQDD